MHMQSDLKNSECQKPLWGISTKLPGAKRSRVKILEISSQFCFVINVTTTKTIQDFLF